MYLTFEVKLHELNEADGNSRAVGLDSCDAFQR